ncbi:MAG: hypothetical protein D8M57_18195 [Candidatus Scalindua sp. AMX11]|nr:MAG: hypothetical protein DWQ00_08175 [Candidatus Scalindua sp.]TDE63454.1 MAG: hypothetical protein D8M57_18195 [Candidatus Scalindua sp. AMX11]
MLRAQERTTSYSFLGPKGQIENDTFFYPFPTGQTKTKNGLLINHKYQITNYKQISNYNSQMIKISLFEILDLFIVIRLLYSSHNGFRIKSEKN